MVAVAVVVVPGGGQGSDKGMNIIKGISSNIKPR